MNPFEPERGLDPRVAKLAEQMDAVTKTRVFGLTQRDAESAGMRESWVTFTQLLEQNAPAIDVPAAVAAIGDRLAARRRRKSVWWTGGLVGLAAACLAVAIWPDVPVARKPAAVDEPLAGVFDDDASLNESAPIRRWRDEVDFALVATREAVEDWEHDFHQSPTELTHVANSALALARDLEESTF